MNTKPEPSANGSNNGPPRQNGPRPNGPRPFQANPKPFAPVPYTADEERRIQQQLNRVLGPEYVSFRPGGGGQNVSYIEGWRALNLANEIFGFNGWSSELINVQVDFLDALGGGRVNLGLSVVVRITIRDGTFHEDFGYGFIENAKTKAVAFEKCKKEAFTDGLKRCLRCFGNVLGNCLYDKNIVAKMQKVALPTPELESDDFHRDPLVVKREAERQRRLAPAQNQAPNQPSNQAPNQPPNQPSNQSSHQAPPQPTAQSAPSYSSNQVNHSAPNASASVASNQSIQSALSAAPVSAVSSVSTLTPAVVKGYDLDDFDDSFVFSDDLPADGGDTEKLDDLDLDLQEKDAEKPTPSQVFFTSSKKALAVQQAPDQNNIPVYDHKFVASTVKRTVDPSKSVKIRRSDLPTPYTPSQINAGRGAPGASSIGKRPLGMPPSQRPPSKRLHTDKEE